MKILLLILALSGLFLLTTCELEAIFKGFRIENNADPLIELDLHPRKFNRTTYVTNGKMRILHVVDDRIKVTTFVNYYKGSILLSKVELYKESLACDEIKSDVFIWPELSRSSGIATECPIEAKEYEIKNFIVNSGALPETIPEGQYEIEEHFLLDNKLHQTLFILVQVIKK